MVCDKCQSICNTLREVHSKKEIINIISGQIVMMQAVMEKGNAEDIEVTNSTITKNLLALDPDTRNALSEKMARAGGIRIELNNCQHSLSGRSTLRLV